MTYKTRHRLALQRSAIAHCAQLQTKRFVSLLLLITIVCAFVPFSPSMPAAGLDSSWALAMNQAVAQRLSIGQEIIFTFGPYASVFTAFYHPATDALMIGGNAYLAIAYWVCLALLFRKAPWQWMVAFIIILAALMYSRDALLFSYPLLVVLVCFKSLIVADGCSRTALVEHPILVAFVFTPFGLLPLVKGNFIIVCAVIAILCCAYFLYYRHRRMAVACVAGPFLFMGIFWILSGQSILSLPTYLISIGPALSGYSEAMAVSGAQSDVISFLWVTAVLLLTICVQMSVRLPGRLFLLSAYSFFLFVAFKSGFIRHDLHVIIASTSILISAALLPLIFRGNIVQLAVLITVAYWISIDQTYIKTSTDKFAANFIGNYSNAWNGLKRRIEKPDALQNDFRRALDALRAEAAFPKLEGPTDVYSSSQAYLIASQIHWSPRPTIQSYAAYGPFLAEKNRQHLLGEQAPRNIVFKVEPLDDRHPAIDDGASWPVLLDNYRPMQLDHGFLFLQRRTQSGSSGAATEFAVATHRLGEVVELPESEKLVFSRFTIKPTLLGRLVGFLFKPARLQIELVLRDGRRKQFKIISGMTSSGFLLSPLVETTEEFAMLYGGPKLLDGKLVKSFAIVNADESPLWQDEYSMALSRLAEPSRLELTQISGFDQVDEALSNEPVTMAPNCDGSIDFLNGISPVPRQLSVSGLLKVEGWLAATSGSGVLADATFVVLTDPRGERTYLRTHRTSRPDVAAYLKQPTLEGAGYNATTDVSAIAGTYSLGLALKVGPQLRLCPPTGVSITIQK